MKEGQNDLRPLGWTLLEAAVRRKITDVVYNSQIKDKGIQKQIEILRGHERMKVIEGEVE
ncbi:MAG: hypothetical protein U9O85_00365 [Euryarchaeota archaeon]|nr:hypothetical protein [Euryarchaeota archaeon]